MLVVGTEYLHTTSVPELLKRLKVGRNTFNFCPVMTAFEWDGKPAVLSRSYVHACGWDGKPTSSVPELLTRLRLGQKTYEFCPGVT